MMMESNLTLLTDRRTSTVNVVTTTDYWCFSFSGERDQDYNNNDKKNNMTRWGKNAKRSSAIDPRFKWTHAPGRGERKQSVMGRKRPTRNFKKNVT